jgi:AcrR family transcriptional regulator
MQVCENPAVPKVVDHEARRAEITRAVWRLIARGGVRDVTVRAVASESGWSMGAVRYYFTTQAELLRFAAEVMMQRVPQRLLALLERMDPGRPRAMALLEELVPLDDERRVECVVWLACLGQAQGDPSYDELRLTAWDGERFVCRHAVADVLGLTPPTGPRDRLPQPWERSVDALHTAVDGLTVLGTWYPERAPASWLRDRLGAHLDAAAAAPAS